MKISRQTFICILVSVIIANISAFVGGFFSGDYVKWLAFAMLITVIVQAIYHFIKNNPSRVVMSIIGIITIVLGGMLIGSINKLSWWIYLIEILVSMLLGATFIFGFTGHKKNNKEE